MAGDNVNNAADTEQLTRTLPDRASNTPSQNIRAGNDSWLATAPTTTDAMHAQSPPDIIQDLLLLNLPPELLDEIYAEALVTDAEIEIPTKLPGPGLLQVCRQIRNDATGIYYGQNAFHACIKSDRAGLVRWGLEMQRKLVVLWEDMGRQPDVHAAEAKIMRAMEWTSMPVWSVEADVGEEES
ncbi:hypothetical protein LTR08_007156 [Meristemomyces frigidus]|nr:hypothetical protein LTR08_007156 [Meristemomyces frigidus]